MSNPVQLSFTQEQLAIIDAGLKELPFKFSAPLIAEINKQLQEQFDRTIDLRD